MPEQFSLKSNFVDIRNRQIYPAKITVKDGYIYSIETISEELDSYVLPGFVDAHVHIESAMMVPTEFSKIATTFGTVATVSDPHEIANVCGVEGVLYMIENAKDAKLKFNFGAPSCVPATAFETSGAVLDANAVKDLLDMPEIKYLTEMMNFPGVLNADEAVMQKINYAKISHKPIDGHAPRLRGEEAQKYAQAGISTDHECTTLEEALDKIDAGMKILIREGSAAKNFEALSELISSHPEKVMLCSDDKHPNDLMTGHINQLVARAVAKGYKLFDVLYAACIAPVEHYDLEVGTLQIADPADFIVVKDLENFEVAQTYINGLLVAENGISFEKNTVPKIINNFNCTPINAANLAVPSDTEKTATVQAIEALDGQLITQTFHATLPVVDGNIQTDIEQDILKIVVVNRYNDAPPSVGFIKNFGLKKGAIASTVAHDSHNIVAVGVSDAALEKAINALIEVKGGIAAAEEDNVEVLPLPVAGLMSDKSAVTIARAYESLDKKAKTLGSTLHAPFMTLSFMALPVIPSLKITDKGLFNVDSFNFTNLIVSK